MSVQATGCWGDAGRAAAAGGAGCALELPPRPPHHAPRVRAAEGVTLKWTDEQPAGDGDADEYIYRRLSNGGLAGWLAHAPSWVADWLEYGCADAGL